MKTWILIFGIIYGGILTWLAWRSRQRNNSADDFILGGAKLGLLVGLLTTAATLFSTFTMQGMPDFFRNHGIGAWIFLMASNGFMFFTIVWFSYYLRKKVAIKGFQGMGGLLRNCYQTPLAGIAYFVGVFFFLIPYVAIQIRGIGFFLQETFPDALPYWAWGLIILVIMLLYSETGGLKAIIFADVLQGTLLLFVIWVIAFSCIDKVGGVNEMFAQVEQSNPSLLSTPGPKGLFSPLFLIATLISISFIPITQPQISTRLVIMKSIKETHRMAVGMGIFAFLVVIPTICIGLYGAIQYPDLSTQEFLGKALLFDQAGFIAAAAIIGLLAAAISTSDSQIFALGSELRSLIKGEEDKVLLYTRLFVIGFAFITYAFSLVGGDQLVLLALTGFAGTALLGPMVLAGILSKQAPGKEVPIMTLIGTGIFLLILFKLFPISSGNWRQDWLVLLGLVSVGTIASLLIRKQQQVE
ncbi:MAG: sodium:solute symporter family protein [Bacteroidota bacterium]